ncbi:MAG: hypothetical protein M2R46_02046 [Verrucomicrobia subdivision 3 bacterium]|nr:hypothetical protein [Limisphaerales bacterium]
MTTNIDRSRQPESYGQPTESRSRFFEKTRQAWGAIPVDPLEQQMFRAATSEALGLAWLSGMPQQTLPGFLEMKIQETKAYVWR